MAASATRSSARRSTTGTSPASVSPTRLSRIQEKQELQQLNDRLAAYIECTRQLENDKSTIVHLLEEKEESKTREMGNVRRIYEMELADARQSLDVLASEKARLQIEYSQLSEDHRKLQVRNQKKEAELANAVAQWRNLEAALNSKDAQYANLLAENRRLETDISDLQATLDNLESTLAENKSQLSSEMLRRVDMENQLQTLREQLEFQRHLSDQEAKEMWSRYESRLVEVNSGREQEFESKLAEAMQQLRQEHVAQVQQYKEELEKNFSAKLENAHKTADKNNDVVVSTREELAGAIQRCEILSSKLHHSQKQCSVLEGQVRELERNLDREREVWHQRTSQKDQEMVAMRAQMLRQLEEYESLLDIKLALDMEINAYRKMLEGEEQRLHLSPSPSQHTAVSRTHSHGVRRLKGRKRKHEGASGSSPAYKVSQHATAHCNVTVAEVDLEGKFVQLENISETEQPLGGWVVKRSHQDKDCITFQIPPSFTLGEGQTLTIWAAGAGVDARPPGDLVLQNHRSWGPVNDVRVTLLNPENEVVAERSITCVQSRGEADSDEEFDEECVTGSDIHLLRRPVSTTYP
ncbi:lamin L3 [Aplochiton taeniatus]